MRRILAVVTGLLTAFFVFYSVRLFVVTGFLTKVKEGGQGAYVGAVVFPVIALVLGWVTMRLWRTAA